MLKLVYIKTGSAISGSGVSILLTKDSDYEEPSSNTTNTSGNTVAQPKTWGQVYSITVKGFNKDITQLKIKIKPGIMIDDNGNKNVEQYLIMYNSLLCAKNETTASNNFLGITGTARKDISKIVFLDNFNSIPDSGIYDVSARRDNSILAWISEENGQKICYIASEYEIYIHPDSSYTFAHIASGENCTIDTIFENFNLLHTINSLSMESTFENFGSKAMKKFNLESTYFETKYVKNMNSMFKNIGYHSMTELDLGPKFSTEKVESMESMFEGCGYEAMKEIKNLANLNTSEVIKMKAMFKNFGHDKLESLTLGENFDTRKVTDMSSMFESCGYGKLSSFEIGNKFKTKTVTNMNSMFKEFGYSELVKLYLGAEFNTLNVTDMDYMFYRCGSTKMNSLDLGRSFIRIAQNKHTNWFVEACKEDNRESSIKLSTFEVFVPQAIYTDIHTFRYGADESMIIKYERAEIENKYKQTWQLVSSNVNGNKLQVVLECLTNLTIYDPSKDSVTIDKFEIEINQQKVPIASSINASNRDTSILCQIGATPTYVFQSEVSDEKIYVKKISDLGNEFLKVVETTDGSHQRFDCTKTADAEYVFTKDSKRYILSGVRYNFDFSNFEQTKRYNGNPYLERSGNITIYAKEGAIVDVFGNSNAKTTIYGLPEVKEYTETDHNENNKLFADFIKPEISYEFSETTIDRDNQVLKLKFAMVDKYFKKADDVQLSLGKNAVYNTTVTKKYIGNKWVNVTNQELVSPAETKTPGFSLYVDGTEVNMDINSGLTNASKNKISSEILNKDGKDYGIEYTLEIHNLPQNLKDKKYYDYSGPITISIPGGIFQDLSGNTNLPKTITIGIDDPDNEGNDNDTSKIVDVVKPAWINESHDIERTIKGKPADQVVITIDGTDKYFNNSKLDAGSIFVTCDGTDITNNLKTSGANAIGIEVNKINDLTESRIITTYNRVNGKVVKSTETNNAYKYGERYQIIIRNFKDYSGNVKVTIPSGILTDDSGNTSDPLTIDVGTVDFIRPVITYISSVSYIRQDASSDIDSKNDDRNNHIVMVTFNIVEKNLVEDDDKLIIRRYTDLKKHIKVYIEDRKGNKVQVAGKDLSTQEITIRPDRKSVPEEDHPTEISPRRYKLVFSGFDENNNAFDYSGPMTIVFDEGIVLDTSGNSNVETTFTIDRRGTNHYSTQIHPGTYGDYIDLGLESVFGSSTTPDWRILYNDGIYVYAILADNLPVSSGFGSIVGLSTSGTHAFKGSSASNLTTGLKNSTKWIQAFSTKDNSSNDVFEYLQGRGMEIYGAPDFDIWAKSYNQGGYTPTIHYTKESGTNRFFVGTNVNPSSFSNITITDKSDLYFSQNPLGTYFLSVSKSNTNNFIKANFFDNAQITTVSATGTATGIRPVAKIPIDALTGTIKSTSPNVWNIEVNKVEIVDVVKPVWSFVSSSIDYTNETLAITVQSNDKYLAKGTPENAGNACTENDLKQGVKLYIDGHLIGSPTSASLVSGKTTTTSAQYKLVFSNSTALKQYSGESFIHIPENKLIDKYGNTNLDTKIAVGTGLTEVIQASKYEVNSSMPSSSNTGINTKEESQPSAPSCFRNDNIVDFIDPVWKKKDSSIDRVRYGNGHTDKVIIILQASDKYYDSSTPTLTSSNIHVFVDSNEVPVTKTIVSQNTFTNNTDGTHGYEYEIELTGFGTINGRTEIFIDNNTIKDTSGNYNGFNDGNNSKILVGNSSWREKDLGSSLYSAFSNSIVDFVKPVVSYQYGAGTSGKTNPNYIPVDDTSTSKVGLNPIILTGTTKSKGKVIVELTVIDKHFLSDSSNSIIAGELTTYLDDTDLTERLKPTVQRNGDGTKYTITMTDFEDDPLENSKPSTDIINYSGVLKIKVKKDAIYDTSGNGNDEITFTINNSDGLSSSGALDIDCVRPWIFYCPDERIDDVSKKTTTLKFKSTDKYYDFNKYLTKSNFVITSDEGSIIPASTITVNKTQKSYGFDYDVILSGYDSERELFIALSSEGLIVDKYGNVCKAYNIYEEPFYDEDGKLIKKVPYAWDIIIDNRRPIWRYIDLDTTKMESSNSVVLRIKAEDRYLDIEKSVLEDTNLHLFKNGELITSGVSFKFTKLDTVENKNYLASEDTKAKLKYMEYEITIYGITSIAEYTILIDKDVLQDESENKSINTTITFSKTVFEDKEVETEVTYFISETEFTYVNELNNITHSGTNTQSNVYRPSSLKQLWNNGKNLPFTEEYSYSGSTQTAKGFDYWAKADEFGDAIRYEDAACTKPAYEKTAYTDSSGKFYTGSTKTHYSYKENGTYIKKYGLYEDIPSDVKYLKAVYKDVKVIFVSNSGNDGRNGLSPSTAVKTLSAAYNKLGTVTDATDQYICLMNPITISASTTLPAKKVTITSVFGNYDYFTTSTKGTLNCNGNITFSEDTIFDCTVLRTGTGYSIIGNYNDLIFTRTSDINVDTVIGGNYNTNPPQNVGIHTLRIERGTYKNIIVGSKMTSSSSTRYVSHKVELGYMRDCVTGDKEYERLKINGYFTLGEGENNCYAYNPSGSQSTSGAHGLEYATINLYSATFTGNSKYSLNGANAAIYLRNQTTSSSTAEGIINFNMYGGKINGNIYGGSIRETNTTYRTEKLTNMNFYRGNVTGNIFGQGVLNGFSGTNSILFEGTFTMTGNVYGGSNSTSSINAIGTGDAYIKINGQSVKITGDVYGGGCSTNVNNSNVLSGTYNVTLDAGTVTGTIYGGGEKIGVATTNVKCNAGTISTETVYGGSNGGGKVQTSNVITKMNLKNVYGGGYNKGETGTAIVTLNSTGVTVDSIYGGGNSYAPISTKSKVTIKQGTATNVYGGGNQNSSALNTEVVIEGGNARTVYGGGNSGSFVSNTATVQKTNNATIISEIYGGGNNKSSTAKTDVTVDGITPTVYGGGNNESITTTSKVTASGNITTVYGGGNSKSTTTTSNITISGTITYAYGGGNSSSTTNITNVYCNKSVDSKITSLYGGGNASDTLTTNIEISSNKYTITNLYGGGNASDTSETANVTVTSVNKITTLCGGSYRSGNTTNTNLQITAGNDITTIYGGCYGITSGSSGSGKTTSSNITINNGSGTQKITTIYGGGYNAETTDTNVTVRSGTILTIYGGGYDAKTTNTNVTINGGTVTTLYGGGHNQGATVTNSKINIANGTLTSVYGGGNYANIGEGNIVPKYEMKEVTQNINNVLQNKMENKPVKINNKGNIQQVYTINSDNPIKTRGNVTINIYGGTIGSANDENGIVSGGGRHSDETQGIFGNVTINVGKNAINSSLVAKDLVINGTIYGSGNFGSNNKYSKIGVYGNVDITLDGTGYDTKKYSVTGSIYGAGVACSSTYANNSTSKATLIIKNMGTQKTPKAFSAAQMLSNVIIDNAYVHFKGAYDDCNMQSEIPYSLNKIDHLVLANNGNLYLRRAVNVVKKMTSATTVNVNASKEVIPAALEKVTYTAGSGAEEATKKYSVTGTNGVENKIFMISGTNLILSTVEKDDLFVDKDIANWGTVHGMTYFGMYEVSRTSDNVELGLYGYNKSTISGVSESNLYNFTDFSYIEAQNIGQSMDRKVNGFYTNVDTSEFDDGKINLEVNIINTTPQGDDYYDWRLGTSTIEYDVTLIASKYAENKTNLQNFSLDYGLAPFRDKSTTVDEETNIETEVSYADTTMLLDVSELRIQRLDSDVVLKDPSEVPNIVESEENETENARIANTEFALTLGTDTGWTRTATTYVFANKDNMNGTLAGDTAYSSSNFTKAPTINVKLHFSKNITITSKDIGTARIVVNEVIYANKTVVEKDHTSKKVLSTTKTRERRSFLIVFTINMKVENEEARYYYTPSFNNNTANKLIYTDDSTVELSYELYIDPNYSIEYDTRDYKVITTNNRFPLGTKLTLIDNSRNFRTIKDKYYYLVITEAIDLGVKEVTR